MENTLLTNTMNKLNARNIKYTVKESGDRTFLVIQNKRKDKTFTHAGFEFVGDDVKIHELHVGCPTKQSVEFQKALADFQGIAYNTVEYSINGVKGKATYQGTIKGYKVGYQVDFELPWIVISKSRVSPYVLGSFLSQDDMEIMMEANLVQAFGDTRE